jgi:hypothetical protein
MLLTEGNASFVGLAVLRLTSDPIGRGTCKDRGDDPSLLFRRYRSHGPHDELSR